MPKTKGGVIYYREHGGAVLAHAAEESPDYERALDKAGVEWKKAPAPADMPASITGAVYRDGKVEGA